MPSTQRPVITPPDAMLRLILNSRVYDVAHETPLDEAHRLSRRLRNQVLLKREDLQPVFSYKLRGAYNRIVHMTDVERARGVIAASAGNHAQGVAFAARHLGLTALIVMPKTTPVIKIEAVGELGAEVVLSGDTYTEARQHCDELVLTTGRTLVHPFDDELVIAGQGTVGHEILRHKLGAVDAIFVPVGGGGLISGIALAVKSQRPDVRVVGVEPEGANIVKRSLESGKPEVATRIDTVADGLAAPFAGELSQAVIAHYVDDVVLVTDDEIVQALRLVLERAKVLVEPAGAASLAALLTGKAGVRTGGKTVAVLSGGNVDRAKLKTLL